MMVEYRSSSFTYWHTAVEVGSSFVKVSGLPVGLLIWKPEIYDIS